MCKKSIFIIPLFLLSIPVFALDASMLNPYADNIEIYDGKAYKKTGEKFPWQLKCTTADRRVFNGCIEARFFDPSTRVYFDGGADKADEIDLFNNGNLNLSLDFVSLYFPWRLGKGSFYDSWSWGPMAGIGITSSAKDSSDGTVKASDAPVVLFSLGLMLEYKFDDGPSFGFEVGEAIGYSSDESYGKNNHDDATYVGLKINIPTAKKQDPH